MSKEKKDFAINLLAERRYSKEKTENHPFVRNDRSLLTKIADVLKSEGGSGQAFGRQTGFKLDDYDGKIKRVQTRAAVDLAFCLDNGFVLLTEAKFRAQGNQFPAVVDELLGKGKTIGKINGSVDILSQPPMVLQNVCVVLVADKQKCQAERAFYQLSGRQDKYQVLTESEFFERFF